jgi:hypothetical protein
MMARADFALDAGGPWLRDVVLDVVARWPSPPSQRPSQLAAFVEAHVAFGEAWAKRLVPRHVAHHFHLEPTMSEGAWPVKRLASRAEVAAWLALDAGELEWFADRRGLEASVKHEPLRHYARRWLAREGRLPRLLEEPKPRLKALQRKVLHEILDAIPPHDAAHGFRKGRSVESHARAHAGQRVVLRCDLASFFSEVPLGRCLGVFRAAGFPEEVGWTLLGLCTTRAPHRLLVQVPTPRPWSSELGQELFLLRRVLGAWHLPQGAPTSPALANLAAFPLDVRLATLAARAGVRYTRYADDLTFSGGPGLRAGASRWLATVEGIVREEGYRLRPGKTRVAASHQRQLVTGLVVNATPKVPREELDRLKAELHRCRMDGPRARTERPLAEYRAHLEGRVAWVERFSPNRGQRLRRELESIAWAGEAPG